ncbi:MAG: DUF6325 family protein [Microthrixaceae bacterium]
MATAENTGTHIEMASGPVDYAVFEFPHGSDMTGVAAEVMHLAVSGTVSLFDVELLATDDQGTARRVDLNDPEAPAGLSVFAGAQSGLFSEDDLEKVGSILDPGVFAILIAYENTWASGFVSAVMGAGGDVVASERIPAETLLGALDALDG